MIDDNEVFYPLKGWEGIYEINKNGQVKSLSINVQGIGNGKVWTKERIKNTFVDKDGYIVTGLAKNNKSRGYSIHRLIAITFIPNPENKPCVNHINGIKYDNRIENLEWVTYSENERHKYDVLGFLGSKCKLKENQVYDIWHNTIINNKPRKGNDNNKSYIDKMAIKYKVSSDTIYKILLGKSYKYLTKNYSPNKYSSK